ncbi:MAG: potassium transporter, partial [Phycisphaerales bacterium]|nr:potassium transporter [Phycisphaerales bacterium]
TSALGGFSTHDASIGYFQSLTIEWLSGIFTLIAAVNFALYFIALRRGSPRVIFQDAEFRFFLVVIGGIVLVTSAFLYFSNTFPLLESITHGFFQSLSIVTSNGHTTVGYSADWPFFVPLLLLLGSFFGGCVGSTCGGIKAVRFLLLYKQSVREIRLLIRPTAQIAVKLGNRPMPDRVMQSVWGFYYLYIFCYCALSLALVATGSDLVTSFGSAAAALNNMGVGLGDTASNFSPLSDTATVLMTIAMVVGRLEVFPVLLLLHPDFWKG